ncbi:hypothetical protein Tco_0861197 [Tanacetum coccineum]|uniref:Uncharacterized protein n=1 Tax=Tanacetum coccineum TaxID=301880 RepID=A0ABQ5BH36_9ASTR
MSMWSGDDVELRDVDESQETALRFVGVIQRHVSDACIRALMSIPLFTAMYACTQLALFDGGSASSLHGVYPVVKACLYCVVFVAPRIIGIDKRFDDQYAYPYKVDRSFHGIALTKTTKETRSICRIQRRAIRRIEDIVCEDSGRYQLWSLLQESPNTPYPIPWIRRIKPTSRQYN